MPVIDGEKWACSSCIKGHRVSGCNHNDRELHHINPKGRPVKQCEHCRGARKSKSHHAKCDCGDKKDKHKDKGDVKAHDDACQCHSGGKCLCGTKKESPELCVDTTRQTLHDARAKPKLTATHSESHLTVFANGHHKPCHRNNNSAHVSGLPYKIPRPHTLHGHSAFASLSHGNSSHGKPEVPTTRSMDTLSLSNTEFYAMFGSNQRPVEAPLPLAADANSLDTLAFQDNIFNGQSTTFAQDSDSPGSNSSENFSTQQWPWTANTITPINGAFAYGSLSTSPSQDCLPNLESDWSMPSAGFNPLWSAGDLPLDPSKLTDSLTQPTSHSGDSKLSGPGLTVASSVHSEVGEPNLFGDLDIKAPQSAASESLFWEDSPVYRLNTSVPSETVEASLSMPTSAMSVPQDLDPMFAKTLSAAPAAMTTTASNDFSETAAISMPSNFEDLTCIDPWSMDQNGNAFNGLDNFDLSYSNPNNWF
ncbi:transcriptional activator haa1 [Coniothyrium glycines]